jgi:two-component system sensor histidine kinase/response regulator
MNEAKILIIEDTQSIRDELRDILRFEGMQVVTAENGQEGIDVAKKEHPDLILCDIMMPVKDGYEVFAEIQHTSNLKHTPFIFLTAKATTDNIRQGMILGADDYITKPFNVDLLINSINSRLEKERERRKAEKGRNETLELRISQAIPHELLTPLNGIMGFSEIMKDPNYEYNIEEIRDFATGINESGNRLLHTIKKFIYYTEIELLLNNPHKHEVLKEDVVEMGALSLANQCHGVAVKYNRLSDLEIVPELFNAKISLSHFEIIISNIVDNAFKFSEKGDKVKIHAFKEDKFINILFQDSGIGMEADMKERVEAFNQFDRNKMEQQGLGLGLITSIKLIKFYGGNISWSKNTNKGTTVKISLLLANENA